MHAIVLQLVLQLIKTRESVIAQIERTGSALWQTGAAQKWFQQADARVARVNCWHRAEPSRHGFILACVSGKQKCKWPTT